MEDYVDGRDPYKKVQIAEDQYVYAYQLKFIANMISDHKIPVAYYKKSIVSYALYNFISDYLSTTNPRAGYFFWDPEDEEFNFETECDELCEAIANAGYVDVWDEME